MNNKKKIVVIGSGPAGYTAALYLSRANLKPKIISGNLIGGQITKTNNIENWPGYYKKLTGIQLMKKLEKQILKFKTKIIFDSITKINYKKKIFKLVGQSNKKYFSNAIIIATGSSPRFLNLPLEQKYLGNGISTCAICDGFFYKNKKIAVIGGGNTAIEEVLYLSKIAKIVYLIHRKNFFTAEKILVTKLMQKVKQKKVILYNNCIVKKFLEKNNEIIGLILTNTTMTINNFEKQNKKNKNIKILLNGIFIAIGNIPNTKFLNNLITLKNNYIVTNKYSKIYSSQTNIPGIFAAGDVVYKLYKQAIVASSSGCIAALDTEKYLNSN